MDISKLIKLQVKYLQTAVSRPLFWCSFITALDVRKEKQTNFDKFFVLLIKLFFALMREPEFQWQYQITSRQYQIKFEFVNSSIKSTKVLSSDSFSTKVAMLTKPQSAQVAQV